MFENDVKTYGTQTDSSVRRTQAKFENDVKTYGTQTIRMATKVITCLRMM